MAAIIHLPKDKLYPRFGHTHLSCLGQKRKPLRSIEITVKALRPRCFALLLTILAVAIPSHHSSAQKRTPPRDRIVIQLIRLDYAEAEHLASVIAPLLSSEGRVVAYPRTNTLIIKDKAYIVKRLVEIIKGPCDQAQEPTVPDICDEDRR
jgi:hypothetical protein